MFPTSLCGVLVFWLPSRPTPPARPSFLPSVLPSFVLLSSVLLLHTQSSCHLTSFFPHTQSSHHLTRTLILVISHLTHNTIISSAHTHTQLVISSSDTHTHTLLLISHIHSQLHLFALLVTPHIRSGRRSIQSLQKGLRRALSPLVPLAAFRVAGAVSRASSRACGARCRRWCRLLSSWQAQYPEPPEAQYPEPPEGAAAPRASRRGCGARCRRWCRWLSSAWQAQYPEPPEGAAARVVAAGAAGCLPRGRRSSQSLHEGAAARVVAAGAAGCCCLPRGRRSIQSLQKGLRRALSPLVPLAAVRVAGAVPRASRRGCGARCRRWCRWLPSAWQAQYPEAPEGAAARVVAAGAAGCRPRGRRSTQSLQKGLRRALSPLAAFRVAGAVSRASRRGCGARCRRWCRWLSSAWQAIRCCEKIKKRSVNAAARAFVKPVSALLPL